jgi:putative transcriptional regulator
MKKSMSEVAYTMAKALYDIGEIDSVTLREFEPESLPEVKKLSSQEIKKMRLREKVSQTVFARYLNISPSTVRQWEQGEKQPQGISLKMLNLVYENGLGILGNNPRVAAG